VPAKSPISPLSALAISRSQRLPQLP
jgi:hypothetical protein